MNKAFVREPELDGRAFCPHCRSLGESVTAAPMNTHIQEDSRKKMGNTAWFCRFERCEVAYFNEFAAFVTIDELKAPIYPKDFETPICACFGFRQEDIEADVADGTPTRIRDLSAKSQSDVANCGELTANGKCCMQEVQRIYMKLIS